MSRVGKQPIAIPSGVKVEVAADKVRVEGPKGKLEQSLLSDVEVSVEDGQVVVKPSGKATKQAKANYGTMRALINNMVLGVTEAWKKNLELVGVGFTAKMQGNDLVLNTGYSHETTLSIPAGVDCKVGKTNIDLESADKSLVGNFAATIRKVCPPEPYLGKGIKYSDEHIRRKAGKTGK